MVINSSNLLKLEIHNKRTIRPSVICEINIIIRLNEFCLPSTYTHKISTLFSLFKNHIYDITCS